MKNSLTLFALLFLLPLHAQSPLEKDMQNYNINYLPEKVFVHADKSIYAGGESIWMAVYLVDGRTHLPGTFTKTVRMELHNGEGNVIAHQQLRSEDGHTSGEIKLPASIRPGDYQLAAFTNYQRNGGDEQLFRKTIRVLAGLKESGGIDAPEDVLLVGMGDGIVDEINLRFFPEGGDCINGVFCRVAVVAEGASGQPVQMEAILKDETGTEITELKTNGTGMGSFAYQPVGGKKFQVVVKGADKVFDLPVALDEGYYISVLHVKDNVRISLKTNREQGLVGSRIAIHLRGISLVDQVIENENQEAVLKLPKAELAPGVYIATLFDEKNQPVAERLFFISPKEEDSTLAISTDREKYARRQAVNLQLSMKMEGVAVDSLAKGRMSLSVLPENVKGGPSGDDIRTWLLLNSDLDRPIPQTPELVFSGDPKTRERKVDEFLMTRGWRRFRWEMTGPIDDYKPDYLLERGVFLKGRMGKYNASQKAQMGKVVLTRPKMGYMEEVETDENGLFDFGPYNFEDTIEVVLQGKFGKGKKKEKNNPYTHLEILPYPSPKLPPAPFIGKAAMLNLEEPYKELSQKALTIARNYDSLTIVLDVVDITAKRIGVKEAARKSAPLCTATAPIRDWMRQMFLLWPLFLSSTC